MGLANLDANLSSNFLTEMYGEKEEEMEEGMYKMKPMAQSPDWSAAPMKT